MRKFLLVVAVCALVVGCSGANNDQHQNGTESKASQSSVNVDCVLTDKLKEDGMPDGNVDTFTKDTDMVYFVCSSKDLQEGQSLKASWVAVKVDVPGSKPNYVINSNSVTVGQKPANMPYYLAKFSLSKPTKGWPVGDYRVDLFLDNQSEPVKSLTFQVQ